MFYQSTPFDDAMMQRCLALAERGRWTCRPNPVVGCVIVLGEQVLAEGWHQVAGQAHAEIHALNQLTPVQVKGATVYVSLEPCVHHGRTGPCADALIASGIKCLVYGVEDPNPLVAGRGLAKLRAAGIDVLGPVLQQQALAANAGFAKRMQQGLPYLRCKVGMSLDARTALANGESQWITGTAARDDVQQWRARSCAILTGIGTLLQDDPALTVRLPDYPGKQPLRVVADSRGRSPATAKLFSHPGTVVVATSSAQPALQQALSLAPTTAATVQVLNVGEQAGKLDLRQLLKQLAQDYLCNEVLVEAGATLTGALLQAGLVDELLLYVAPTLLGDTARPLAILPPLPGLTAKPQLRLLEVSQVGEDCRIRALVTATGASAS
jgi:diaminohydroxyphosphoribosylaminopyrimidine deaminase/5-amino-6-(5-phosphoribosylamino)uracil reductase